MTKEEAKFILSAFRPNGADAGDAAFCDAVRMAGEDPMLAGWFAQSRSHDEAVAAKLKLVGPPPGLRAAILAGVKVSDPKPSSGLGWGWLAGMAAAAAIVIGFFVVRAPAGTGSAATAFGDFAINDMVNEQHGGKGEAAAALVSGLEAKGSHVPAADQIDFEKLRETGCRTVTFAGHDVVEVCFARDGAIFHLYITRRDGPVGDSVDKGPSFISDVSGFAAVWSDRRFDYAVASTAGVEAIRRLL